MVDRTGATGAEFLPECAGQENNNRGTDQTLFPMRYWIVFIKIDSICYSSYWKMIHYIKSKFSLAGSHKTVNEKVI